MDVENRSANKHLELLSSIDVKKYGFYDLVTYLQSQSELGEGEGQSKSNISNNLSVLFKSNPSLAFQPADIADLKKGTDEESNALRSYSLSVNFLGLHGANSPIPAFYTEDMLGKAEDESASRQFLDLFNHRLIELLYQSWRKYQVFKRNQIELGKADSYLDRLLGIQYLDNSQKKQVRAVVGLKGSNGISSHNFAKAISLLLGKQKVEIMENIEDRVSIGQDNCLALGKKNTALGKSVFLGDKIRSYSSKYLIRVWVNRKNDLDQTTDSIKQWITVFGVSYLTCIVEYIYSPSLIDNAQLIGDGCSLGGVALGKTENNIKITRTI